MSGQSRRPLPTIAILLLSILLLVAPLGIRVITGAPITPGDSSYRYVHEAQEILAGSNGSPYAYVLAPFLFFGVPFALPPLLGILSLLVAATLLRTLIKDEEIRSYALLLFAITPLWITISTTHTPLSLFLLLFLVGILAHEHKKSVLTAICIAALPTLLPIAGLLIAGLVIVDGLLSRHERGATMTLIFTTGVVVAGMLRGSWPPILIDTGFLEELGGLVSFSVFAIVLAIYGLGTHWGTMKRIRTIVFALLLVAAAWLPGLRTAGMLFVCVAAAWGMKSLFGRRWTLALLRNATILLLACLALFVVITHEQLLVHEAPSRELLAAAREIRIQPHDGTLLTTTDYDEALAYYADIRTVNAPESVLSAVTVTAVHPWLVAQNVRYILVTDEMRAALWTRDDEGLLFLLENNEKFITVSKGPDYTLSLFLQEYAVR